MMMLLHNILLLLLSGVGLIRTEGTKPSSEESVILWYPLPIKASRIKPHINKTAELLRKVLSPYSLHLHELQRSPLSSQIELPENCKHTHAALNTGPLRNPYYINPLVGNIRPIYFSNYPNKPNIPAFDRSINSRNSYEEYKNVPSNKPSDSTKDFYDEYYNDDYQSNKNDDTFGSPKSNVFKGDSSGDAVPRLDGVGSNAEYDLLNPVTEKNSVSNSPIYYRGTETDTSTINFTDFIHLTTTEDSILTLKHTSASPDAENINPGNIFTTREVDSRIFNKETIPVREFNEETKPVGEFNEGTTPVDELQNIKNEDELNSSTPKAVTANTESSSYDFTDELSNRFYTGSQTTIEKSHGNTEITSSTPSIINNNEEEEEEEVSETEASTNGKNSTTEEFATTTESNQEHTEEMTALSKENMEKVLAMVKKHGTYVLPLLIAEYIKNHNLTTGDIILPENITSCKCLHLLTNMLLKDFLQRNTN